MSRITVNHANTKPLPFGSTDSRVLFQHDLKSPLTLADLNGMWEFCYVGSNVDWDAEANNLHGRVPLHTSEGMRAVDTTDLTTETGYRFAVAQGKMANLYKKGQMSFKVKTAAIETFDAVYNDDTWSVPAAAAVGIITGQSGTATNMPFCQRTLAANKGIFRGAAAANMTGDYASSAFNGYFDSPFIKEFPEDGPYTQVDMVWEDSLSVLYLNGSPVAYRQRPSTSATYDNPVNNLYIGSNVGATDSFLTEHEISDLLIAEYCPKPIRNYHIGMQSDSMFTVDRISNASNGGYRAARKLIEAEFNKQGISPIIHLNVMGGAQVRDLEVYSGVEITSLTIENGLATMVVPGHVYSTNDACAVIGYDQEIVNGSYAITKFDANTITFPVAYQGSAFACTSNNGGTPTISRSLQHSMVNMMKNPITDLFFHGTTNDAASLMDAATVEAAMKNVVEIAAGVNGNPATVLKRMFLIKPPARILVNENQDAENALVSYHAVFDSLPAWFKATYPDSDLVINTSINMHAKSFLYTEFLKGQSLLSTDVHYAPRGQKVLGEDMIEAAGYNHVSLKRNTR